MFMSLTFIPVVFNSIGTMNNVNWRREFERNLLQIVAGTKALLKLVKKDFNRIGLTIDDAFEGNFLRMTSDRYEVLFLFISTLNFASELITMIKWHILLCVPRFFLSESH